MTELLTPPNGAAPAPPAAARDFTKKRKRLDFTIDSDTFEAAPVIPGDVFAEFITIYNSRGDVDDYQQTHDMLKHALSLVLLPDSYERFTARLKDHANPIDDDQMGEVLLWLLEEYGMRPTQPSQPSSDGSANPESGTSSTENTQPAESTSAPSQPTAS
ncbi:hypothetical protein [Streptomyces sp. OM5714]|uniref:hypothetical protein n=1 Tax=Streptomyces sp. OM5714 TaxID=2602736 RepID=UPI0013D91945|nr:hypothetical protein [Streptomyces sp. OM5714]KAF2774616.1 hypothetical protein STPH1_7661 [Streptomyces sp. OM5714]